MASLPTRSLSQHLRHSIHPSQQSQSQSQSQSPALVARIEEKRAELQNLHELRDLSAAVAGQMEALEHRLSTLTDGTEDLTTELARASAIAAVIGNWHNVLRAINMASAKLATPAAPPPAETEADDENEDEDKASAEPTMALPQTLVRIPTDHAPTVQAHAAEADSSVLEGSRLG